MSTLLALIASLINFILLSIEKSGFFEVLFATAIINLSHNLDDLTIMSKCPFVKEVASLGGDVSSFVPENVNNEIIKKFNLIK